MKRIVLERLTLRNFKGIKEFNVPAAGRDIDIFGDNATGKTTIFDGFLWLLFGKDSENRTEQKFEIKELNIVGMVQHHKLEHEIEGTLLVDGHRRIFRRVYAEKWTKKRGAPVESFEGHTTTYNVDGVPLNMREFQTEVDSIIKEDLFRLLTSPSYFNEVLKKEDRRKVLLEVSGDLTDDEVIHSNKELAGLPTILVGREMEAHKKVITARSAAINKEIKELPVRISEVQRQMPDATDLDEELLKEDVALLRSRIESREAEVSRILSGGEVSVKEKRLREVEAEQIDIKSRLQSSVLNKMAEKRNAVNLKHAKLDQYRRNIEDKQQRIKQYERLAAGRRQEADRLRADFNALKEEVFEHHHDANCPTCGQTLPDEQIKVAHEKAEADFNLRLAERKAHINADGKAAVAEAEKFEQEVKRLQVDIEELNNALATLQTEISAAESELTELRAGVKDPAADPEYAGKIAEATRLQQEIVTLRQSSQSAAAGVREEIGRLRLEVEDMERDIAKFDGVQRGQQRVAELEQQESSLAAEYERLQHELFLCEEFTRTKVNLLDAKINSKFKLARFRLFEEQVNGGLKEVCDTLYKGVPYEGGLNNAARINVGLDIINTLSQHYGVSAPVIIDNAEAVTKLIYTDAQVIRLVVSEKDKKLRIETAAIQEAI
ncbi:AAA family ATPase [Paenibacillus sp. B2(2019)]|uniref:AAA family ATPase n=1 Tax=Paenibacillus sp. B2(2019) TaxID=2607754 RepID=UPI0011F11A89|nr:AAA family ATPase [Paenibacillus sp. B2(2019)]KAA1180879.1 hypothetical protein PAENI_26965 [Paenibacillus sp. B2(2019)]